MKATGDVMRYQRLALVFWWLAWAASVVILRLLSSGIPETGDGVTHHMIARFSWQHPILFLDHWGKPLFTLLSSPFAQLGLWGMALFNAVCFLATCWAADGVLKDRSTLGRWLFAPLLLCMPVYGAMVFSGLTEVLFGLLALTAVCALWHERYVLAMVIASFLPFARPEYVAVWPFVVGWVIWKREWKALPWLALGHVIYACIGVFVYGDPLWAFTRDPYTGAADVYGHGPLLHFTDRIQHIYGAPFMWILAVAIVLVVFHIVRSGEARPALFFLFTALLPAFAIIAIHSVLWWKGWKSSLGLTRVLATGAPLGALFVCAMLVSHWKGWSSRKWLFAALGPLVGVGYIVWAVCTVLVEYPVPIMDSPVERVARKTGETVAALKDDHPRVVHAPPLVTLFAGVDPFDTATFSHGVSLRPNDLLVWDAAFGPNEGGMQLNDLLNDPGLELLNVIVPEERWIVLGGNPMEYFLFAKRPSHRVVACEPIIAEGHWSKEAHGIRCDTVSCGQDRPDVLCLAETEFPLELGRLTWDMHDLLYAEVILSGHSSERFRIVIEQHVLDQRTSYWAQDVSPGEFKVSFHLPPHGPDVTDKLYVINLDRKRIVLTAFQVELCTTRSVRPT